MTMHRRDFLAAGSGLACAALLGGAAHTPSLLLYSKGLYRDAAALRDKTANHRWIAHQVSVLTHDDFLATNALLAQSGPGRIMAVLNDADQLVIEHMLAKCGVREMTLRRAGTNAFLLTAAL